MYQCDELYLYEILEDYQDAASREEKEEIFRSFCSLLWSSSNKRRVYTKAIRYHVRKDLLNTETGQVFLTWSDMEYQYYKSLTKEENWCAYIRQKINNIYTRYFDKEVILEAEYLDLIKTPKRLYYEWISGMEMEADAVTELIDDAIDRAEQVKKRLQSEKMTLSWTEYKKVTESFLYKCFENCRLISEYEDKSKIASRLDFITEDHFYVGYICRCLDGEIRKWQKKYYHLPQSSQKGYIRCSKCGKLMVRKSLHDFSSKYCEDCKRQKRKEANRKYYIKTKPNSSYKPYLQGLAAFS